MSELLTDDELDDLLGWVDAEHLERAIAELRELREQNAALVTALDGVKWSDGPTGPCWCLAAFADGRQNRVLVHAERCVVARAALASVRGDA